MSEMTAEQRAAVKAFLGELNEVVGSVGRHEGHKLKKFGRCVGCSCGYRYQGVLPSAKDRAECAEAYRASAPSA